MRIKNKADDFGWGIIVDYKKDQAAAKKAASGPVDGDAAAESNYIISVLMYVSKASADKKVH